MSISDALYKIVTTKIYILLIFLHSFSWSNLIKCVFILIFLNHNILSLSTLANQALKEAGYRN